MSVELHGSTVVPIKTPEKRPVNGNGSSEGALFSNERSFYERQLFLRRIAPLTEELLACSREFPGTKIHSVPDSRLERLVLLRQDFFPIPQPPGNVDPDDATNLQLNSLTAAQDYLRYAREMEQYGRDLGVAVDYWSSQGGNLALLRLTIRKQNDQL